MPMVEIDYVEYGLNVQPCLVPEGCCMVSFQDEDKEELEELIVPKGTVVDVPDDLPRDCVWTDERGRPVTFPLKVYRDRYIYMLRE